LFCHPAHPVRHANGVYAYGAHRTHTEELYEVTESSLDLAELRDELLEWKQVYNTVRPHQALGYVTPLKFLGEWTAVTLWATAVTAGDKPARAEPQGTRMSGKEDVSLII